jgi:ketosteroid isomerase-like protein
LSELDELKDRYRRSLEAFIRGDPEPQKPLWSRRDDVTLANPFGPPAKGLERVFTAMDSAAAAIREGEGLTVEVISSYETADLAYEVAIQGGRMKFGDSPEIVPVALRVTTIFRRDDDGWKLVHRHADPITEPRQPESLVQSTGGTRRDAAS